MLKVVVVPGFEPQAVSVGLTLLTGVRQLRRLTTNRPSSSTKLSKVVKGKLTLFNG